MTNINVDELYEFLDNAIPKALSCEWDNDGRMCVPDTKRKVNKVLICLDVSEEVVGYAVEKGFDCIISHHPLVFNSINGIDTDNHVCRKLCRLIKNDISVLSFHTRLDKVNGGVNDALADALGMKNITDFSDVGRQGELGPMELTDFGKILKEKLLADRVMCVDGGKKVSKIAIVGGSGKGYLEEAAYAGCDTFVTGEIPFNCEHDAKEIGVNLVCGGHYFTENIVCERLEMLVRSFDENIYTEKHESNPAFIV